MQKLNDSQFFCQLDPPVASYADLFRLADDTEARFLRQPSIYYNTSIAALLERPYGLAGNVFHGELRRLSGQPFRWLRRNALVVPVKNPSGKIWGITDWEGNWLSSEPVPHVVNAKESVLGVHVVERVIEADLLGDAVRHCIVALNGLSESALWYLFPHLNNITILSRSQRQVAA